MKIAKNILGLKKSVHDLVQNYLDSHKNEPAEKVYAEVFSGISPTFLQVINKMEEVSDNPLHKRESLLKILLFGTKILDEYREYQNSNEKETEQDQVKNFEGYCNMLLNSATYFLYEEAHEKKDSSDYFTAILLALVEQMSKYYVMGLYISVKSKKDIVERIYLSKKFKELFSICFQESLEGWARKLDPSLLDLLNFKGDLE